MRISDWSSDVCSSDLVVDQGRRIALAANQRLEIGDELPPRGLGVVGHAAPGEPAQPVEGAGRETVLCRQGDPFPDPVVPRFEADDGPQADAAANPAEPGLATRRGNSTAVDKDE